MFINNKLIRRDFGIVCMVDACAVMRGLLYHTNNDHTQSKHLSLSLLSYRNLHIQTETETNSDKFIETGVTSQKDEVT